MTEIRPADLCNYYAKNFTILCERSKPNDLFEMYSLFVYNNSSEVIEMLKDIRVEYLTDRFEELKTKYIIQLS